jgi:hypothetical protein
MNAKGMTLTVLATQLAEAVSKDETPEEGGCDVSAGMYGPHASQWLRDVAEALCAAQREAAAYKWGYEYLQSRMHSIDRHGWAEDCDGEIEHRIAGPNVGIEPPKVGSNDGLGIIATKESRSEQDQKADRARLRRLPR